MVSLKCCIPDAIGKVQAVCELPTRENLDETDRLTLLNRCREILLQGYAFGFEVRFLHVTFPAKKYLAIF